MGPDPFFLLSENYFISLLHLNNCLAQYRIQGCTLFSYRLLNMQLPCLPESVVSDTKCDVNLWFILLCMIYPPSTPAAYRTFLGPRCPDIYSTVSENREFRHHMLHYHHWPVQGSSLVLFLMHLLFCLHSCPLPPISLFQCPFST